jgi:hypothetical protein
MSVRQAHTAIRRMLSIRGRRGWVGRLWAWIGLTVVFGVVVGAFPLFGVLGFELATASALFAAILGLDLGGALAREMQRMPAPGVERAAYPGRSLSGSTLVAALLPAAIMVIPAVIAAVRGIWVPTCDWWFGVESYLAMPIATALFGGALGHALGVVVGPRRFLGAAVALLPVFVVAGAALYRFYAAPPVFTYNAILGYFPGNLYDENVQLGSPLAWSRLEELLWVVAIVAACATRLDVPRYRITRAPRPGSRRLGALAVAVVVAAGAAFLHTQSGRLGYRIDAEDIEDALDGRIETAHFIIHYAKTDEIEADIALIAADHEFRYAQVVAQLGAAPPGKIRAFLFADRDQKAGWMGARDVEMAKPWRQEIYLDHRAYPHPSLRHEIAHAVASAFGDPIFGVATRRVLGVPVLVSPGLIEGLAVAIDWPGGSDRLTPHEAVRALQVMGKAPSIRDLLSLKFFSVSSATGYTTAGSFLRFLLETYGAARLRTLYASGGDFADAYGKPLAQLESEWLAMIATIELPTAVVDASRERFRGGSVFARPCPHAIAKRRERAFDALAEGDRPRAIDLMRHVCGDAPEEPRHRLELGDMLSGGDDLERSEAAMLWTGVARDAQRVTSTLRAEAFERLARIAATRGDWVTVRALIGEAVKLPLDSNERRQLDAEALALAHTGPAGAALRGYFWPGASRIDPPTWALLATLAEPELGFTHYLLGLQQRAQKHWAEAAESLDRALALGLPSPPFVRNAARHLAIAGYRTHDRPRIDHAIAALSAPELPTVDHLLAQDWAARLAFDATLHP